MIPIPAFITLTLQDLHFIFQKLFPNLKQKEDSKEKEDLKEKEDPKERSNGFPGRIGSLGKSVLNDNEDKKDSIHLNVAFVDRDSSISYYRLYPTLYLPHHH